ncbi:MAG: NADH-quinone oxidoreductase subunit H, partial [Pseudonocardiaceae bacterium]
MEEVWGGRRALLELACHAVVPAMTLAIPVVQALQVLTVLVAAPGINGVIARVETRLQGRRGSRVLQPYYDIAKLFGKEALAPFGTGWVFLAAPLVAMTCYLTVPLL